MLNLNFDKAERDECVVAKEFKLNLVLVQDNSRQHGQAVQLTVTNRCDLFVVEYVEI